MARSALTTGTILQRAGETFRLTRIVEDQTWQMENTTNSRVIEIKFQDLLEEIRTKAIRIQLSAGMAPINAAKSHRGAAKDRWNSMPEAYKEIARRRLTYVKAAIPLSRTRGVIEPVISQLAGTHQEANSPSCSTVLSWVDTYIQSGHDICALAPKFHKRGKQSQFDSELDTIVDAFIEKHYLTRERNSLIETRELIAAEIDKKNQLLPVGDARLPIPSLRRIRSRLELHTQFDICCSRFGKEYAARKFMTVLGYVKTDSPLERVEIDHTILDLMVFCDETALPLGRPTLTLAIDVETRSALGYYLGFEPPSYCAVSRCLMHAMLPKTYLKEKYPDIQNTWDCYGAMENLVVDNGLEFHARALEEAAARFGTTIQYCPRATPHYKGAIERFIGNMNRGVAHGKPGTTFSNIFDRADYDPKTTAAITLSALHEIIHTWIVDYYHQRVHSATHKRPATAWAEGTKDMPIPLPVDMEDFEAAFAIPEERTLDKNGIKIHGLIYNGAACTQLRIEQGAKIDVKIRYLPEDLGYIYVENPDTGEALKVPVVARHADYATGLSLYQHRICKKYALSTYESNDIAALGRAKQRIAEIVSSSIRRKKIAKQETRYKHAGRTASSDSMGTATKESSPTELPRTPRKVLESEPRRTEASLETPSHTPKVSICMVQSPRRVAEATQRSPINNGGENQ